MKNRFLLFCTLFVFIFSVCKSQDYKYIYYLDADLNSITKSKAVILAKGIKENGLMRLDCFSMADKRLYMALHFTDSTLQVLEGPYTSYHLYGKLERQGNYHNGTEEGTWQEWDTLGRKTDSTIYKFGKPIITATFDYYENGSLSYYTIKDSLQDSFQTISYDEKAAISSEVFFKGQKGILKTYRNNNIQSDSLFTREEVEASFPGGDWGWTSYLKNNLDANTPIDNNAREGTYQVIVKFMVTEDGSIEDVFAETHHGHGMEKEVIRIIKKGPKWIPAFQYGRKVRAYRRQPCTFVVSVHY